MDLLHSTDFHFNITLQTKFCELLMSLKIGYVVSVGALGAFAPRVFEKIRLLHNTVR